MTRLFQSLLGAGLFAAGCFLAIAAVTSKGVVVLEWPLATIILTLIAAGGHLVSKSLWLDAVKGVTQVLKARKSNG